MSIKSIVTTVTVCIMTICGINASAQLRYGFRFGGEFAGSTLSGAPEGTGLRNGSGFSGGLVLEYQAPRCGLAPDIAVTYSRHNTRLTDQDGSARSFGRNFIDIPLHLKYKFWLPAIHDLAGPMVYTGPAASIRLDHDDAAPLSTHRLQWGWDVGVGFDIVNFIQITAGYRFALGNAADCFGTLPPDSDISLHQQGWNVAATLLFDF